MTIYRIHPDRCRYALFSISGEEVLDKLGEQYPFHIDPSPRPYQAIWSVLEVIFYDSSDNGTAAELPDVSVESGRLFLSTRAYEVLHSLLEPYGEFLPITYGDSGGYLFNVLSLAESVDGLDSHLSTKSMYGDLQSLSFHEEKVGSMAVFRTEFDDYMGIFCTDEFKEAVEDAMLRGITFSPDLGNIFPPDPSACREKEH